MSEKLEHVSQSQEKPVFDFSQTRIMFTDADPSLRLNQLSLQLEGVKIELDDTTWVSRTIRGEEGQKVVIGAQKLPLEIQEKFAWGVDTKENEIVMKAAHELSHVFQKTKRLEEQLMVFLSGSNTIKEEAIPYIELYATLAETGSITGLADMSIYHDQTQAERERVTTGIALDVRILEDITELIAAYSIGDEYFNFRLEKINTTDDSKKVIARCVVTIFHNYIK